MIALNLAAQTDVGQRRHDNQDTFLSKPLWSERDALLAVIDGVGGYAGGDRAAEIARNALETYMTKPTGDTLTMLREAVVYANNQIVRHRQEDPNLAQMCCVLTVAVPDTAAQRLLYVHVGDTRMYRFRAGRLEKLTHDHSIVGVREDAGQLTERQAMNHPRRNEILRDVGSAEHRVDDPDFLESDETDFRPGDVLLLCSDGLTDMLTRAQITDVLTQTLPLDEQVAELIRRANEAGGQDNITVVLAQLPAVTDVNIADEPAGLTPVAPVPDLSETKFPAATPPATDRRNLIGLGFALGSVLLAGLAWWHWQSTESPAPSVRPEPVVRADSSIGQPDSSVVSPNSSSVVRAALPPDSLRRP